MATLKNKRKLAAVTRGTQVENPRNGQSRNKSVPRINEEYITQVSQEIESRVTEKLSQEYSRTESRILGALSKSDESLLKPQIRTHSGTVLGTFRNTNVENQGTNEDDSQSDPHPEAGIFRSHTTQNSGPEFGHDMLRRVQKESFCGHDRKQNRPLKWNVFLSDVCQLHSREICKFVHASEQEFFGPNCSKFAVECD